MKEEEELFLFVFLLMKTLTVVGGVWIEMTKRIKRKIKEVNFSVSEMIYLTLPVKTSRSSKQHSVSLGGGRDGTGMGRKKKKKRKNILSISKNKRTCPMFMGSNPMHVYHSSFTDPNTFYFLKE